MKIPLCMLSLLSLAFLIFGKAVLPAAGAANANDFYLYFDTPSPANAAQDSSGNKLDMLYYRTKESILSKDIKKFGAASLHITGETVGGIRQPIETHPHSNLAQPIDKMSVVLWIYLAEGTNTPLTIMSRIAPGAENRDGDWRLMLTPDNGLRFSTAAGSLNTSKGWIPMEANQWIHLAFTYDQSDVRFYVNGEAITPATGSLIGKSGPIPQTILGSQKARIECLFPTGTYIDDLGFFGNVILTQPEIQEIVKNGLQPYVRIKQEGENRRPN